jgi:hypothetical protein
MESKLKHLPAWGNPSLLVKVFVLVAVAGLVMTSTNIASAVGPNAIRSGFDGNTLTRNDDGSTPLVPLGFTADFFGTDYTHAYVNNNGNMTFDSRLSTYTPFNIITAGRVIIAPFFADVDTRRAGDPVKYGSGTVDGHTAWGATYANVDCYSSSSSRTNRNYFQVVLIQRSDTGPGNFDIEFNYDQVQWDAGQASGGNADCLNGSPARVGYSNGTDTAFELDGSGVNGAFLDSGPSTTSLIQNSLNSDQLGRYIFNVREGEVLPPEPTNEPPVADAGEDQSGIEATSAAGASVSLDGTGSTDPDSDPLTYSWSAPGVTFDDASSATPTGTFPLGTTEATLTVDDGNGGSDTDAVLVTVVDTTAPTVDASVVLDTLWSPNHKMVDVGFSATASDAVDSDVTTTVEVSSSEVDNDKGDGDTSEDIQWDEDSLLLRAERDGRGDGRTYTITVTATDDSGNSSSSTVTVSVPKSKGKK